MRLKTKRNIFTGLKTITAALLIILQVYPIFYVIISSMKTTDDFRSLPSYALPSALNFENYIKVFTTSPMLNYFKNTINAGSKNIRITFFCPYDFCMMLFSSYHSLSF